MEFETQKSVVENNLDQSVDLRDVIEKYLIHYKWFIFSVLLFVLITFIKVRYEAPQFRAVGSILIKEKEAGNSFSEMSTYEDMGLVGLGGGNLENEMQVLQSKNLIMKLVKELKLNFQYFDLDGAYPIEIYPNTPFLIDVTADSTDNITTSFEITVNSRSSFELKDYKEDLLNQKFNEEFRIDCGNAENSNFKNISVKIIEENIDDWIGKSILVKIVPVSRKASQIASKLEIEPINERVSNVVTLSITEANLNKGIAIINNLIEQYNADGVNEKLEQTQSTIDFLDLRIGLISSELNVIESTAEKFKTDKGVVNVNSGADLYLASSTSNEREIVQANTEMKLVDYLINELNQISTTSLLPSNIGLSDPLINAKVSEYNDLILQRNRILRSSSTLNPIVVNIDSELEVLKISLVENLKSIYSSLEIRIQGLNRQRGQINTRIASAPKNEKTYKDIIREQETKNELYLFLLQKREEAIVAGAANVPKAKIINEASSNGKQVSPNILLNYIGAIFLGLVIPFLVIFIKDLLDTKIHDQGDLKKLGIPYLGDFPKSIETNSYFISEGDNSNIAEAFRFIRTNINFMLDTTHRGNVVFVTSTMANEGKTFTSMKLASSLALSGKRVLLIAMDLRKPKIYKYLGLNETLGVSNFLSDNRLEMRDVIMNYEPIPNLDICGSGDIPPNPVELLMNDRIKEVFEFAKENYDYVIVDTAPVGMVTDTLQISNYADLTIYIIKSKYLDKRMLHIPKKMHEDKQLKNMAFLINGLSQSKRTYGYKYGYGDNDNQNWANKIKTALNI